jgi:hypothetical protein
MAFSQNKRAESSQPFAGNAVLVNLVKKTRQTANPIAS